MADRAGFENRTCNSETPCDVETSGECSTRACQALCQTLAENDPNLAALVNAWPALPEAIRAGILAIVEKLHGKEAQQ